MIMSLVQGYVYGVWIGLRKRAEGNNEFIWSDNSEYSYNYFKEENVRDTFIICSIWRIKTWLYHQAMISGRVRGDPHIRRGRFWKYSWSMESVVM